MERCPWCGTDPLYVAYHDEEWGVPERDGRALWEKLVLDGFQAGLAWITILRKRDAFRRRFEDFDPVRIAEWGEPEIAAALGDARIVRHRGKVDGAVRSARALLAMGGPAAFGRWAWDAVDGRPLVNAWSTMAEVPAATPLSSAMSKELKAKGFTFCGPTIVYAWMQASGLVNDHLTGCPRRTALAG